jgi:hypothetical protein
MIFIIILIFVIIFNFCYNCFQNYVQNSELLLIEGIDGNNYYVRDNKDKNKAAEILYELRNNIKKLISFIEEKSENDKEFSMYKENIMLIKNKIDKVIIKETPKESSYTSYSVNKGEELYLCIRSKNNNEIHDINDLLYVAIHEIAHIGCPEIGHTNLFFKINLYLLKKAVEFNLYKYDNYNNKPREYCGINLNNTLLN